MTGHSPPLIGVIEGFYGRPWSHESRLAYADLLGPMGLNSYLYCPKSDPYLRRRWREAWPDETHCRLQELAEAYRSRGHHWGVGLSPFALYENYDGAARTALQRKIQYLGDLGLSLLAILFDDMPGGLPDLAARQSEIVEDICGWTTGSRILVCPTYYSFDPVLEKFFGARPDHYWQDLGRGLPDSVEVFWTGNEVCSEHISATDVEAISRQLGRAVVLWDNYPVNDGAVRSNFLYTAALSGRDAALRDKISGHFCNPMNQALLSIPALLGLGQFHGTASSGRDRWLAQFYGEATYRQLQRDADNFQTRGRSGLGEQRCREMADAYMRLAGPAAAEVAGWLRGEYTFDPACLTD